MNRWPGPGRDVRRGRSLPPAPMLNSRQASWHSQSRKLLMPPHPSVKRGRRSERSFTKRVDPPKIGYHGRTADLPQSWPLRRYTTPNLRRPGTRASRGGVAEPPQEGSSTERCSAVLALFLQLD